MKSTSAAEVIIQALCPGPDDDSALGVPLVMYASRSATRVARSGVAGAAAAGAAGACAEANPAVSATTANTVRPARMVHAAARRPLPPPVPRVANLVLAFTMFGSPFLKTVRS